VLLPLLAKRMEFGKLLLPLVFEVKAPKRLAATSVWAHAAMLPNAAIQAKRKNIRFLLDNTKNLLSWTEFSVFTPIDWLTYCIDAKYARRAQVQIKQQPFTPIFPTGGPGLNETSNHVWVPPVPRFWEP